MSSGVTENTVVGVKEEQRKSDSSASISDTNRGLIVGGDDTEVPKTPSAMPQAEPPKEEAPKETAQRATKPAEPAKSTPKPEPTVVLPPVNVEALSCPDPVDVDLEYRGKVQIRRIAADIVKQWGLKAGPMDVLPEDKARTFYWKSSATSALFILARGTDWTWYRDGSTVRFVKRDDPVLRTAGIVATKFKLNAKKTDGGLSVSIDSDLGDRQTITVSVRRLYRAKSEAGKADTYSESYGRYCGLAAQWRAAKLLPVDDKAWKADLLAHQDKMAPLGPDMAFEIESIEDRIVVEARARGSNDEVAVAAPLTISVRAKSTFVGADYLRLWESYETLNEVPLIARSTYPGERGMRLKAGTIFRVEGIEHSQLERWYLVSIGDHRGWINSIALLRNGVTRVAGLKDHERRAADLHRKLMANVFGPCLEYAYNKLVKSRGSDSHSARRAMFESVQPHLEEMVSELAKLDLSALPESEVEQFYRKILTNCKSGVGHQ